MQRFGSCGALHDIVECFRLACFEHLWRKPYFQPLFQSVFGSHHQPVDIKATDSDGVTVQIALYNLKLTMDNLCNKCRTHCYTLKHTPHVVVHSFAFHRDSFFLLSGFRSVIVLRISNQNTASRCVEKKVARLPALISNTSKYNYLNNFCQAL